MTNQQTSAQTMTQLARSLRLDASQVRDARDLVLGEVRKLRAAPRYHGCHFVLSVILDATDRAADLEALAALAQSAANPMKRARLAKSGVHRCPGCPACGGVAL